MVRCSVMQADTGQLLLKSRADRHAVHNFEPNNVDFIQPLISKCCTFKEAS